MIKLCVFDFDSTLMDGESIDILAKAHGKGEQTSQITHCAMSGKLDFFESLQKRVRFLKNMSYEKVLNLASTLPLMKGAYELVEHLNSKNIQMLILSGGFHECIHPIMQKLGIKIAFANYLHHKNGLLTGLVGGEMMFSDSKGLMLKRLKSFLNLQSEEVMCVGDGANDIAMFDESGLKIAFCAKELLRSRADICIDTKNLEEIIKVI